MSSSPATQYPVARVLPMLGLAQLDRPFDYLVTEGDSDAAQPGVRVRIRFAGRLVDAIVLERTAVSSHEGNLRFIERVISPEVVAPEQLRLLIDALAQRYAGVRSDIYRSAIPARHAKAEETDTSTPWDELGEATEPDLSAWSSYQYGESFVDAVLDGKLARAAWQVVPGEDWAATVGALAAKVALSGGGALVVVPDQRDVDRCEAALREYVSARQVTTLTAKQGPQARYSRYLSILHGQGRIVVGTRSAAFAPVRNLRLMVLMHDGDESLVDPRAPYAHAREVLTTRSAQEQVPLIIGGYARTAETQLFVERGWMHELLAPRAVLRQVSPRIHAAGDSDAAMERDPRARQARMPSAAFMAARAALRRGTPVLFQVPRTGYIQSLACGQCRAPARCRWCNGPLGLPAGGEASAPTCRWCGRMDPAHVCPECGSKRVRAMVLGTERTAEELGRAFAQFRVRTSWGDKVLDAVPAEPAIIVSTPGAEPVAEGGYGAAVLLDVWALLQRPDLRAVEDTYAKWAAAAALVQPHADGGEVVVVAEPSLPVVQHLIRWDARGHAALELAQRRDARFPPAVHIAVVDAPRKALDDFFGNVELPDHAEVLGPVDLPPGIDVPGEWDRGEYGPAQRMLVRSPLHGRAALGSALRTGLINRAARRQTLPLRVQVNPIDVG
ncbi:MULTISPECIES: primosomal protein N' [Corynebacterium]|uniref:Probable replication restart protein PriA n=1 Tax=Corynebacterium hadale TaxID=2026255 RepID=A0A269PE62_9CORY|nr:primosomal protein N' [Corynebacterium hadale]PAJ70207.1 primosome assembly protein PriA [Corynebacterium hadale]WKC60194.1 Primosomal protein N' [Corynebacterium hadale]